LTINGTIRAGRYQIFDWGNGSGALSFGDESTVVSYPEWFGAIDGTADNVQIQAALDCWENSAITGIVECLPKNYVIAATIAIPEGVALAGAYDMFAVDGTKFTSNVAAAACVQMGDGATVSNGSQIKNIRVIAGTGTDGIGIYIYYGYNNRIINCRADGFTAGTGIKVAGGSAGVKPTIQTLLRDVYLANNLTNLHLTGNDANDDSSSDEGYYDNVRISLTTLANSKGIYIEKGYSNQFNRVTIVDQALTAGTIGIKFDDGARSVVYSARANYFFALNIEVVTTPFQVDANCSNNVVFGGNIFNGGLTPIIDDASGGMGLVIRNFFQALNVASYDWPNTGQTTNNLLYNTEFERWENGTAIAPTGWTLGGVGATIARDAVNQRKGTYCAAVTRAGADTTLAQNIIPFEHLKGRQVTAACWVKASVASRAMISINDGVGQNTSIYHTGSGSYELMTVSKKVSAAAAYLVLYLQVVTGNTTAYFDQVIVTEGVEVMPPQDTPLLDSKRLYNTIAWDPGNLADGAGETKSLTVNGAALGDFVLVSAPYDLQDCVATGYVQAANTVEIRLQNESTAAHDFAWGIWKVMVFQY